MVIDGREVVQGIKLVVRMPRAFGFRMWLTTKLLGLVAVVSGCTVEIEVDDETEGT
jgi:hypothetical protein